MPTIKGKAFRFSTAGLTFTLGIVSATTPQLFESWSHKRSATQFVLKDDNADRVGEAYSDDIQTFSCEVIGVSASTGVGALASAQTSTDALSVPPGTKVTLVDANGTILDGSYVLDDAELSATKEGAVSGRLTMHKSSTNDITVTAS